MYRQAKDKIPNKTIDLFKKTSSINNSILEGSKDDFLMLREKIGNRRFLQLMQSEGLFEKSNSDIMQKKVSKIVNLNELINSKETTYKNKNNIKSLKKSPNTYKKRKHTRVNVNYSAPTNIIQKAKSKRNKTAFGTYNGHHLQGPHIPSHVMTQTYLKRMYRKHGKIKTRAKVLGTKLAPRPAVVNRQIQLLQVEHFSTELLQKLQPELDKMREDYVRYYKKCYNQKNLEACMEAKPGQTSHIMENDYTEEEIGYKGESAKTAIEDFKKLAMAKKGEALPDGLINVDTLGATGFEKTLGEDSARIMGRGYEDEDDVPSDSEEEPLNDEVMEKANS